MYHNLSLSKGDKGVEIDEFENQIKFLNKLGYKSFNLRELTKLEKKNLVITFDDGYENVHKYALPILKKYNFKATSFIVSNKIDKFNDWDKANPNSSRMKLANFDQISEWIDNGFEIGSHSTEHQNLTKLGIFDKVKAIDEPIKLIREKFKYEVESFCYPYGKYDRDCISIVKKNYNYAVTTKRGRYNNKINNYEIPRLSIDNNTSKFKIFLKLMTIYEDVKYKPLENSDN